MAAPRKEKAYEKYAWLIFIFLGLSAIIPAYFSLSGGVLQDGLLSLVFAVLTTFLSLTAYRKGRKWAWFALLYTPLLLLMISRSWISPQNLEGYPFQGLAFLALVSVVGLVLPYRKFFPKKQPVKSSSKSPLIFPEEKTRLYR